MVLESFARIEYLRVRSVELAKDDAESVAVQGSQTVGLRNIFKVPEPNIPSEGTPFLGHLAQVTWFAVSHGYPLRRGPTFVFHPSVLKPVLTNLQSTTNEV